MKDEAETTSYIKIVYHMGKILRRLLWL